MRAKLKQTLSIIVVTLIFLNPVLVMAQGTKTTNTTKTTGSSGSVSNGPAEYKGVDQSIKDYLCTPSETADGHDLERCINRAYRFGVAFGAIAVVFFVIMAGYMYLTGGTAGKAKGKIILQNALAGMALLLGSYVLLSFINPSLVAIRPIQPPIFEAGDIVSCDKVGLGKDCVLPNGGLGVSNGAGGGTAYADCPDKNLVDVKGVRTDGTGKICAALLAKLVTLKAATANIPWLVTSTVDGKHLSDCHAPGHSVSGVCADLALDGGRLPSYTKDGGSTNPKWGELCRAVQALGGISIANEASKIAPCPGYKAYETTTGPNLHIFLAK